MERGLTDYVSNNMATCHVEEMLGGKSRRLSAFQQAYENEEKFERKYFAKRKTNYFDKKVEMGDEEDLENEKVIKYDSNGSIDIDGLCQRPTG